MKEIPLTQGKVALVDDEDFDKLSAFKWSATYSASGGRWYALRTLRLTNGKKISQMMHRFIMGLDFGDPRQVDHKDRINTLDNRRSNLRIATRAQNHRNVGKRKDNTSGFKGVFWHKATQKWQANIRVDYRTLHLGLFPTPELAAQAYDAAVIEHHKEFAVTNASLAAAA
jgi:hypothetical protein